MEEIPATKEQIMQRADELRKKYMGKKDPQGRKYVEPGLNIYKGRTIQVNISKIGWQNYQETKQAKNIANKLTKAADYWAGTDIPLLMWIFPRLYMWGITPSGWKWTIPPTGPSIPRWRTSPSTAACTGRPSSSVCRKATSI